MKFIAEKLEKIAERKVERKARVAASAVDISRIRGENPENFKVFIGRRPWAYTAKEYADKVGALTMSKLEVIKIEGIVYDSEATEQASLKPCLAGMGGFDADGRTIMAETNALTTNMMGRLTLVLSNEQVLSNSPGEQF